MSGGSSGEKCQGSAIGKCVCVGSVCGKFVWEVCQRKCQHGISEKSLANKQKQMHTYFLLFM